MWQQLVIKAIKTVRQGAVKIIGLVNCNSCQQHSLYLSFSIIWLFVELVEFPPAFVCKWLTCDRKSGQMCTCCIRWVIIQRALLLSANEKSVACACVSFVFKVGVCVGQQPRLCLTRHSTLLQTGVALVSKPRTSEADFGVHQKGKEEFPTQAKLFFFFLLCAITPEHSLDCCQDLPCKTWFLFSHDGHFYDILFVTTGTSEGIWWHRWMLLPQFLLIHFQRVWFPLIHHFFPLSHTFSFSPWGLWLGSYLTWPISLFYPRVPRLNTPLNAYTCLSVSSGRMCVPPLCVCVCVCVCVRAPVLRQNVISTRRGQPEKPESAEE